MSENVELKQPSIIYKDDFLKNVYDYRTNGEMDYFNIYKEALEDFELYVRKLSDHSMGKDLPDGWTIPYSTFWLVNDEKKVFGIIRIRHKSIPVHGNIGYDVPPRYRNKGYGTKLLELSLPRAKEIGLNNIILTCEERNIFSEKIIRSSNGRFLNKINDADNIVYNQYIIEL